MQSPIEVQALLLPDQPFERVIKKRSIGLFIRQNSSKDIPFSLQKEYLCQSFWFFIGGVHIDRVIHIRLRIRDILESAAQSWKNWIQKHPLIINAYMIFSWLSLIIFALGLLFSEDARKMFVQYFWSFYILIQIWLLCRSKTLTWRRYTCFFLAGAWVSVPLTVFIVHFVTILFGGEPRTEWSQSGVTPVVEELIKLLPLGIYLFLSRRSSFLSLSDFALMGGATGAGFQFAEEIVRRWTSGNFYGVSLLGGDIHWSIFDLFPGQYDSMIPIDKYAGHEVSTAFIALGIGFALRFRIKTRAYIRERKSLLVNYAEPR